MKNVLVVHGTFGSPFENWFPWLHKELSKEEISCIVPSFPTPDFQNYNDWKELLNYYVERNLFNGNTIVVGHSCGAVCLAKFLIESKIDVLGYISVAGYNNFAGGNELMDSLNASFYFDENLLAKPIAQNRYSFYSENDPNIPLEKLIEFTQLINSNKLPIKDGGHFNARAGYTDFPQLLDIVKSIK